MFLLISAIGMSTVLSGCKPSETSMDVAMIVEVIKFASISAVVISAIGGVTILIREYIRRPGREEHASGKRPLKLKITGAIGIIICMACFAALYYPGLTGTNCNGLVPKIKMLNQQSAFTFSVFEQLNPFLRSRVNEVRQCYNKVYLQTCRECGVADSSVSGELDAAWGRAEKQVSWVFNLMMIISPGVIDNKIWEAYKSESLGLAIKLCG